MSVIRKHKTLPCTKDAIADPPLANKLPCYCQIQLGWRTNWSR